MSAAQASSLQLARLSPSREGASAPGTLLAGRRRCPADADGHRGTEAAAGDVGELRAGGAHVVHLESRFPWVVNPRLPQASWKSRFVSSPPTGFCLIFKARE